MQQYFARPSAGLGARLVRFLAGAALVTVPTALMHPTSSLAAASSVPSGLVVVIEDKPQQNKLNLRALSNPEISGVALQIHWSELEPTQANPNWSKLDQLFAAADASKKWVQLLIFPGFFTPAWALQGVQTQTFPLQYGPGKGTLEHLPLPWDSVYLERWFAFLKLLSARYGNSPAFRVVAAAGPTSVSAESSLPAKPPDVRTWLALGYTPRKYIAAWQRTFQFYAGTFPQQHISLSMGSGPAIDDRGRIAPGEHKRMREEVIDQAMAQLGGRFVLQFSNLDAFPGAGPGPRAVGYIIGFNGRVITGVQLRTSCERNSQDMSGQDNPVLCLQKSIDIGLQPNGAGQRVNYLEMYEPDVIADDLQSVLRGGAARFK